MPGSAPKRFHSSMRQHHYQRAAGAGFVGAKPRPNAGGTPSSSNRFGDVTITEISIGRRRHAPKTLRRGNAEAPPHSSITPPAFCSSRTSVPAELAAFQILGEGIADSPIVAPDEIQVVRDSSTASARSGSCRQPCRRPRTCRVRASASRPSAAANAGARRRRRVASSTSRPQSPLRRHAGRGPHAFTEAVAQQIHEREQPHAGQPERRRRASGVLAPDRGTSRRSRPPSRRGSQQGRCAAGV